MFKNFWYLVKQSLKEWGEDKASRLAAALSYYTIFSISPLLVIVIAIAGFVWGRQAAQGAIVGQIQGLVGQQGAQQVQTMIQNANRPGAGIVATVIGVIVLLLGASGVFNALQDSLNTIWEVKLRPGTGVLTMATQRFLSFAMVLAIGFLLMVSLVVTAALSALGRFMLGLLPGSQMILQGFNFLISFAVITLLFALIYKYLPDGIISWRDVWLGAAVTSLLFTIGKLVIGLYLGSSSATGVFGAAGSLIVILLWIYYSGQILFLGAEFTQVYARRFGHGIRPKPFAELMTDRDRVEQGIPHQTLQAPPDNQQKETRLTNAMPGYKPVPVTGVEKEPLKPPQGLMQAALPAAVAFLIGIAGSLAIAREQRKRPIVKK